MLSSAGLSGFSGYKLCYQEVLKVVRGVVLQPYELKDSSVFYAFSYYFDRAVDAGLIGETRLSPGLLILVHATYRHKLGHNNDLE